MDKSNLSRLLVWALLVLPSSIALGKPTGMPKAAVLGFKAKKMAAEKSTALTEILATELARTKRYRVITPADVNALIDLSAKQDMLGCDSGDCLKSLSEIGGALNVARLLSGNITKMKEKQLLNIQVLDPKTSTVVGRGSASLGSDLNGTLQSVRQALLEALGYSGRIVLWNQPEGAELFVNGHPAGTCPVAALHVEKAGKYKLQVFHDNRTPWEQEVDVRQGSVLRVKVDSASLAELEEDAASRRAWSYGFLGAGAVIGAAAGVMWGLAGHAQQQYDNTDFRGQPVSAQQPMTDTIMSRTVTAGVLSAVALGGIVTGLVLLLDNPYENKLEAYTSSLGPPQVSASLTPTSGGLFASLSTHF